MWALSGLNVFLAVLRRGQRPFIENTARSHWGNRSTSTNNARSYGSKRWLIWCTVNQKIWLSMIVLVWRRLTSKLKPLIRMKVDATRIDLQGINYCIDLIMWFRKVLLHYCCNKTQLFVNQNQLYKTKELCLVNYLSTAQQDWQVSVAPITKRS